MGQCTANARRPTVDIRLRVTCGLTACTPGSAPGPMHSKEYERTLPLFILIFVICAYSICGKDEGHSLPPGESYVDYNAILDNR